MPNKTTQDQASWEQTMWQFIQSWQEKDEVVGAFLTGSYATGCATPQSDIDIHFILAADCPWRERGNTIVDGFIIEYFANTLRQHRWYFENEAKQNKRGSARMFTIGQILFDKNGDLQEFQKEARTVLEQPFPAKDATWKELNKYALWDSVDGLIDVSKQTSPFQSALYYKHLEALITTYAGFLNLELPAYSKIYRYLTENNFATKYHVTVFPDPDFSTQFCQCITNYDLPRVITLTKYVQDKLGGFDISDWKLRTPNEY